MSIFAKKKDVRFKPWHGALLIVIVAAAVILGIYQRLNTTRPRIEFPLTQVVLNEETCTDAGGMWQECGSACRGQDSEVCIEVCVEYCLCVSSSQCPYGYTCADFASGTGVCQPFK